MNNSVQINVEDALDNLLANIPNLNVYKTNRVGAKLFPFATISASVGGQLLGNYTGVYEVAVTIDYSDTAAKISQEAFDAEYCQSLLNCQLLQSQSVPSPLRW